MSMSAIRELLDHADGLIAEFRAGLPSPCDMLDYSAMVDTALETDDAVNEILRAVVATGLKLDPPLLSSFLTITRLQAVIGEFMAWAAAMQLAAERERRTATVH